MRQVAVGFIYNHDEERLLTAQRLDHAEKEVELLGGVMLPREDAACALDRALMKEIDGRVNYIGHVATWKSLHQDEDMSFEIIHAELQAGSKIRVREKKTHSELAWRTVRELGSMTLAPALEEVRKWLIEDELVERYKNGVYGWRKIDPSGITEVR